MPDNLVLDSRVSCAFTGHRNLGIGFDPVMLEDAVKAFIKEGFVNFYCGMAMGFDLIAAQVVLEQKKTNPHIKLIACVPCPNQQKNFPVMEKAKYEKILPLCDRVELVSDKYYRGCMLARDRFMVDSCDRLLAYIDRNDGGAAYTVRYARSKNKDIYIM